MTSNKYWVAFFSQTGSEIAEVAKELGFWPNRIVTNKVMLDSLNKELRLAIVTGKTEFICLPKPGVQDYLQVIPPSSIVTLHGYLKIMPPEVCEAYEIYNGHPGLISKYPELKGKDPQKKALTLNLPSTGCVIHEVEAGVDEGRIVAETDELLINHYRDDLETVIYQLHKMSVELWVCFLKWKLFPEKQVRFASPDAVNAARSWVVLTYAFTFQALAKFTEPLAKYRKGV